MEEGRDAAYQSPDSPDLAQFQRLDQRVRYLNEKGITADLVLAGGPGFLTKVFPTWVERRRFMPRQHPGVPHEFKNESLGSGFIVSG